MTTDAKIRTDNHKVYSHDLYFFDHILAEKNPPHNWRKLYLWYAENNYVDKAGCSQEQYFHLKDQFYMHQIRRQIPI